MTIWHTALIYDYVCNKYQAQCLVMTIWRSATVPNLRSPALLERTHRRLGVQPRDPSRMRIDWSPGWPGFAIFYTISKVTSFSSLVFFYIIYNDRLVIDKLH